jgi:hypothetical protein
MLPVVRIRIHMDPLWFCSPGSGAGSGTGTGSSLAMKLTKLGKYQNLDKQPSKILLYLPRYVFEPIVLTIKRMNEKIW